MNRINLILLLVCLSGLALSAGCEDTAQKMGKFTDEEMAQIPLARRSDPPAHSDGLALSVKSETITISQVMDMLKVPAGSSWNDLRDIVKKTVINKIIDILLYQEAMKNAPENIDELLDAAVDNERDKFIASYGNNYALAQEALAEDGMDWQQYHEFQKKFLLINQYISRSLQGDKPISHSQMLDRYEAMQQDNFQFKDPNKFKEALQKEDIKREGFIVFRLIDIHIEPGKVEVKDGETCKDAAFRKAAELIERIKQGENFGELAKLHSDGHRKEMGGLWTRVTEGSGLSPLYHVLPPLADKMEVGEVADPVESDGHIFIMKLEDKRKGWVASFESLQAKIELVIQLEERSERFDRLIEKLKSRAKISGLDRFIDVCVGKAWSRGRVVGSLSSK